MEDCAAKVRRVLATVTCRFVAFRLLLGFKALSLIRKKQQHARCILFHYVFLPTQKKLQFSQDFRHSLKPTNILELNNPVALVDKTIILQLLQNLVDGLTRQISQRRQRCLCQ